MNTLARSAVLMLCLTPYVYFGVRDILHHREHRRVSFTERLLHCSLGVALAIVIPHACLGNFNVVVPALVLFVAARTFDEFVFHRGLAPAEVDLHAKTHFSFLIFVVGVMGTAWVGQSPHAG